jgi:hypothetical protein
METVLLDQVIFTDYGQFDLTWSEDGVGFDGDFDRFFAGQDNGSVGAGDLGGVYVHFARRSGGSPVRIVRVEDSRSQEDVSWEDVVEVSVIIPDGSSPRWSSWAGEDGGALLDLIPGSYRVRVSARGRDQAAEDEFSDEPLDAYLIELWPAALEPDHIVRTTSANAAYWHQEWGSRS